MTQAAFLTGIDTSAFEGLNFGKLIWLAVGGLVVWAFKKDWIGIVTFGPYDRGFREFFGRPRKLLKQGPHPHIIGIGNLRRASVSNTTVPLTNRVAHDNRIYLYRFEVVVKIVDEHSRIYAAIYETFDEGKKDSYNPQRIAYVKNCIEEAIRKIIESTGDPEQVTVQTVQGHCMEHLLLMCGTEITKVMLTEFTPVDAQILKDGMLEQDSSDPGRKVVVPFQSQQHQTA